MAAPTYQAGTFGNVLNNVSVAASKNAAALVDLSTVVGGKLHVRMFTGATPPTVGTTFSCNAVYGANAAGNTTLSAAVTAGATTFTVNSATGIVAGAKLALIVASSKTGEVVTVASVSGTTVTLGTGTTYAYAQGDLVFLVEQAASGGSVAPGSSWSGNTPYSTSLYPPAAWVWIVQAANGDGSQPVTVSVTLDTNPSFA